MPDNLEMGTDQDFRSGVELFTPDYDTGLFIRGYSTDVNVPLIEEKLSFYNEIIEKFNKAEGLQERSGPHFYYHNRFPSGELLEISAATMFSTGKLSCFVILEYENNFAEKRIDIIQLNERRPKGMTVWSYDEEGKKFGNPREINRRFRSLNNLDMWDSIISVITSGRIEKKDPFLSIASSVIRLE